MAILSKIPRANTDRLARIGYNNLLTGATGATVPRALIPNTYERWIDNAGTATGVFQLSANATIDYVAIAAHNFFSSGSQPIEISTAATVGGARTLRATITPQSDEPIMHIFDQPIENVAEVIVFTADIGTGLEVGIVYAGQSLIMEQPIYGGHVPIDLSAKTQYQNPMSETGQFLGRHIKTQGSETNYSWRHLTPDFIRGEFRQFIESAKTLPFFIKWRPDLYETTAFGHVNEDIKPTNMGGGHQLMQVSFNMLGHSD